MKRPRDSYVTRVYAAEQALLAEGCRGFRFEFHDQQQSYVDRVCARIWTAPVQVVWSRRLKGLHAYSETAQRKIVVPANGTGAWCRTELVTLHELAHICQPPLTAYHGLEFLKVYFDLVNLQMGPMAMERLVDKMERAKVPLPQS